MPNLTPLVVGLVEVGAGILVPHTYVPLMLGKLVETIISDQKEIQQAMGLIHGRINRLEQRVTALERRQDELDYRLNQLILQPFRTGNDFLEIAKKENKKKARRRFIEQAQNYFIQASKVDVNISNPTIPFSRTINCVIPLRAQFYVGVCYDLLDKREKAFKEYNNAWELIVSLIRSQDVVYNKWHTIKKSELDWLAKLISATARKGTGLTNEEASVGILASYWDMGKILESTSMGKPMESQRPLEYFKNDILRKIVKSPKARKEQQRERYAKRMTILDNYPDSLDNLINPRVNDKETQLLRKYSPVSLISPETHKEYYLAQLKPSTSLNPFYDPTLIDPKSLKLDYQESRDAWALAIGLTTIIASRKKLDEPTK